MCSKSLRQEQICWCLRELMLHQASLEVCHQGVCWCTFQPYPRNSKVHLLTLSEQIGNHFVNHTLLVISSFSHMVNIFFFFVSETKTYLLKNDIIRHRWDILPWWQNMIKIRGNEIHSHRVQTKSILLFLALLIYILKPFWSTYYIIRHEI